MHAWNKVIGGDAAESGSGPGSYNIKSSVWHVNCCNAEVNGGGGWGIFNAILGWENSATYGSVLSYNLYWLAVVVVFMSMRYCEKNGHWPLMKPKAKSLDDENVERENSSQRSGVLEESAEKKAKSPGAATSSNIRETTA